MKTHKSHRYGCFLAIVILVTPLLAGCDKTPAKQDMPPPQAGYITIKPQSVLRTTELAGRTNPIMSSDVRPQVNGVIQKRLFTEGSEVKEGEQLYQIDPAPYQATYDSAVATLTRNEAALVTANAKAERYKPLSVAKAVSTQDYDDAVATAKEAEADIASAKAAIETARINLQYTKVLAPISGHIGRSSVTPGALVTANQTTSLATVTALDPIYVDMNQAVAVLLRLRRELENGEIEAAGHGGAKVTLKLEDGTDYDQTGELQFSEVTVDAGTGTVLLRAIFPNPKHILLPGMFVRAVIQEGINKNGILVPQQAVSRNTHGDAIVYVLGEDNKVALRTIKADQAMDDKWIVTDGLKAGERVIVDGLQSIHPGTLVHPVEADNTPPANKKS